MLQQLGERLLQGKTGSIVAINPANGEILCLATNTPQGYDVRHAIGKPQAPGSTIKTAQALTLLSEGIVTTEMTVDCNKGFIDGNIRVGCHQHRSPLKLKDAIAQSCNSWFLVTFAAMINDNFIYEDKNEAITTWRSYMQSMGLGGPMHIDIKGRKADCSPVPTTSTVAIKENGMARPSGGQVWDKVTSPLPLCSSAILQ